MFYVHANHPYALTSIKKIALIMLHWTIDKKVKQSLNTHKIIIVFSPLSIFEKI